MDQDNVIARFNEFAATTSEHDTKVMREYFDVMISQYQYALDTASEILVIGRLQGKISALSELKNNLKEMKGE